MKISSLGALAVVVSLSLFSTVEGALVENPDAGSDKKWLSWCGKHYEVSRCSSSQLPCGLNREEGETWTRALERAQVSLPPRPPPFVLELIPLLFLSPDHQ